MPTSDKALESIRRFHDRGIAVVYVDRFHTVKPGDIAILDDLGGSHQCVRHLAAKGHRRIAIIAAPLKLSNARMRLEGIVEPSNRRTSQRTNG